MKKAIQIGLLVVAGIVLLLLAAAGLLTLTRDTPARVVHAFGEASGPPPPGDPAFRTTVELFTQTRLSPGHDVEILLNGDGTFPRLWSDMRSARRSLTVQQYYCEPGAVTDTVKAILTERARAGVTTHLLYDGFGCEPLTDGYVDSLRVAGVRVAVFRPVKWYTLHKAQLRSHARAVVIDGGIGYTGGFGFDDRWLGGGHVPGEWRDTNTRFRGDAVAQLQAAFAIAWTEATGELIVGDVYFPHADSSTAEHAVAADGAPGGGAAEDGTAGEGPIAGLLFAAPTLGSTTAERLLALTIASARERLYIANAYPVPREGLRDQLLRAAARGVDVRLLVPNEQTDVPVTRYAARSLYDEMMRAGVRIYEYQPAMMHAKTFVADGVWSAIGSMNLDTRSIALNDETVLLVLDAAVGAAMEAIFRADLENAEEIVLSEFVRRSWPAKLRDWAAGLFVNLL